MEPDENDSDEIDITQQLGERQSRCVYLITYSQADLEKLKIARSFLTVFSRHLLRMKVRAFQNIGLAAWRNIKMGANIITLPSS